ncbi:hypothetical protein [Flavobacterium sp. fv08]|uniref:hypothetical protein n=1 Tax=Flavobacterium sp. fv08 TaxID=1761784 RepID=UPI0008BD3C90|nr:hypothetical protein [Flavobacterium sp. fv08]SEP06687.1 hypothetical protein SAMN04487978_4369 [Flavobacterium sp. fv08]
MIQNYPLEWLDSLVSITLNPSKMYLRDLSKEDIQNLSEKAVIESMHIQSELKNQVFALHKESQIRLLVQKYHSALIILLDTLDHYLKDQSFSREEYGNIAGTLISCLDELLFFIETRYLNHLTLEERVPPTYLSVSRSEMKLKLNRIQKNLIAEVADPVFTSIVLDNLQRFVQSKKFDSITLRELLYRKELLQKLEQHGSEEKRTTLYNNLHELLVYMNYNSRDYINYFTKSVAEKINALDTKTERVDSLHFHYKEFSQMQSHQSFVLYPEHDNLRAILDNWFHQEILYLEKTMHLPENVREIKKNNRHQIVVEDKIIVNLSADQLALILRAFDESQLLAARSMSQVFRQIIPYISTPFKKQLSYDAVRSKSYHAEERDKEIVRTVLEKMIKKVETY